MAMDASAIKNSQMSLFSNIQSGKKSERSKRGTKKLDLRMKTSFLSSKPEKFKFNSKSKTISLLSKKIELLNNYKIKQDTKSNINTPRGGPARKSLINELVEWSVG